MSSDYTRNDSGWRPSAGKSRAQIEKEKAAELGRRKRGGHGASAPSGPSRGSGYGTESSKRPEGGKRKPDKPKKPRGHGASAPYGPIRPGGYGTEKSKKPGGGHQDAAGRRLSGGGTFGGGRTSGGGTFGHKSPKGLQWRSEHNPWGSYTPYDNEKDSKGGTDWSRRPTSANKRDKTKTYIYSAGSGASWGKIAKESGVSVADLKKANPWQMRRRNGVIYRNSKIRIPGTN